MLLSLGTYDITIHTSPEVDSMPLARDIYFDVLGVERINGKSYSICQ